MPFFCVLGLMTAGCGAQPQSPERLDGAESATATQGVAGVNLNCDAIGSSFMAGELYAPQAIAKGVATTLSVGDRVQAGPVNWLACSPQGEVLRWHGDGITAFTFEEAAQWKVAAQLADGQLFGSVLAVEAESQALRFDLDELDPEIQEHVMGALPWPSEFYRAGPQNRISLSRDSVKEAVPDALEGIAFLMAKGVADGYQTLKGFPLTSGIVVETESVVSAVDLPTDPTAFSAIGSPILLLELDESGALAADSARLPLIWDYSGVEGLDEDIIRKRLTLRLPDGQILKEGREYLYIITTGVGTAEGPLSASEGFQTILSGAGPAQSADLYALLQDAVDILPDIPTLDVIASAGHFKTHAFRHHLKGIERCLVANQCEGVNQSFTKIPEPAVEAEHIYLAEGFTHAGAKPLHDYMPTVTGVDTPELFPSDHYGGVIYGTFSSPVFQRERVDGIRDVFQIDASDRVVVQGVELLKFTLIMPKEAPASSLESIPVVFFVHGLAADQSDAFLAAEVLTQYGFAVMAIDQVAHGSRYDLKGADSDSVNNLKAMQEAFTSEAGRAQLEEEGADGLSDARLEPTYSVLSILNFFEWLGNFRAMGDNFRQVAADLYQMESLILNGDLNDQLTAMGFKPLDDKVVFSHGRSLGAIALGVYLPYSEGERVSILGVPGAGVATHLAGYSPYVGDLLTLVSHILVNCPDPSSCREAELLPGPGLSEPSGTEYLAPSDPFTRLVQGLIEPGDPLVSAAMMDDENREEPVHIGLLHSCRDEIVPNAATYNLTHALHISAIGPAPGVSPSIPQEAGQSFPLFETLYSDVNDTRPVENTLRDYVSGNWGDKGSTRGLLTYCPGTHSGLFDRPETENEHYEFYPGGPYPQGGEAVFPPFNTPLYVENAHFESREALVNFFLTGLDGTPKLTLPLVEQFMDMDSDGIPDDADASPYGANPALIVAD